ncbi:MAG TPA: hypothetical protein VF421_05080 [Niabella sp.]
MTTILPQNPLPKAAKSISCYAVGESKDQGTCFGADLMPAE